MKENNKFFNDNAMIIGFIFGLIVGVILFIISNLV